MGPAAARTGRPRRALIAVILSGLGPGAGHVYVGLPRRGALLVSLWLAATLAWITQLANSWDAARFWSFPSLLALLAILVDSGRQARRAPVPFELAPWQHWTIYSLVIIATGFLAPLGVMRFAASQVAKATVPDDGMSPWLEPRDEVVVRPFAREVAPSDLRAGDVVAFPLAGRTVLRRVVGLPGQRVEVRLGRVFVGGQPWLLDPRRAMRDSRLGIGPLDLGEDEVLALSDARTAEEAPTARVRLASLSGRAVYVLVPGDLDPTRMGAPVQ
jgi:hypothetical protein